jgi:hypothetical protein
MSILEKRTDSEKLLKPPKDEPWTPSQGPTIRKIIDLRAQMAMRTNGGLKLDTLSARRIIRRMHLELAVPHEESIAILEELGHVAPGFKVI